MAYIHVPAASGCILLLALVFVGSRADMSFSKPFKSCTQILYDLNADEGLTGTWTGIDGVRNKSIGFSLWFVNNTENEFRLSIIEQECDISWIPRRIARAMAINYNPKLECNISRIPKLRAPAVKGKEVWTANQERPVKWGACLEVSEEGSLELKDTDGTIVWSTNIGNKGVEMLDMGNLILITTAGDSSNFNVVKLARAIWHSKFTRMVLIVGAAIGSVSAAVATSIVCMIICTTCRRNKTQASEEDEEEEEEEKMLESSIKSVLQKRFQYSDLEIITNNFTQVLGSGGFGTVYKGTLDVGKQVAVKKLEGGGPSVKEFLAEIATLTTNKHANLVQLLGYSRKCSVRMLVYEYMENGSLDNWLFNGNSLSWELRYKIAKGTARGLAYMQEECSSKTIHLDLKPQNILLDSEFNPKIGDFGLAKLMERDRSYVITTMRGTPGYLAPEWLVDGLITEKVDVYSFGVVILELITGRRNREWSGMRVQLYLLALKEEEESEGIVHLENLSLMFDRNLKFDDPNDELTARRLLRVAVLCIQDDPKDRPKMSEVGHMMQQGSYPIPKLAGGSMWFRPPSRIEPIFGESEMSIIIGSLGR